MKLRWRILGLVVPVLIPVALGAAAVLVLFGNAIDRYNSTVSSASAETIAVVNTKAEMGPTGAAAFSTIMTGGPVAAYREAAAKVDQGFARAASLHPADAVRARIAAANHTWEQAKAVGNAVVALPTNQWTSAGLARMPQFVRFMDATAHELTAAQAASQARLNAASADAKHAETQGDRAVYVAMGVALLVGLLLARMLTRSILRPVRALREGAERLSAGQLSYRVDLDRGDELGEVAAAFDSMAAALESAQGDLRHQAFHDALTGLPNRALLMDRLSHALARCARRGGVLAVLLVDLDHFKSVNDTFGHVAGDQVLIDAAQRIRDQLRASDTTARLGGDEFAVLLEDLSDEDEAVTIADRIVTALSAPVHVGESELFLGGSVGLVISGGDSRSAGELLRNADLAMYRAKQEGRGRCVRFAASMHAAAVERLGFETELRRAIDEGELTVHYQPTVDLASGRMTGVEALVRWNHPRLGLVEPAEFVPLAEDTGLIVPLGLVVLETACREVRDWTWRHPELAGLNLHVNLSGRQLDHPDLVAEVVGILDRTDFPTSDLTLEITESVMSRAETTDRVRELKKLGIRIAMDDFGTGYSSLSYLQRFPIDVLKIDKSFVERLGQGEGNVSLALAVVMLARSLGLTTVAEGIEDDRQLAVLRLIGCRQGQGFLFARPLESDSVEALLVEHYDSPAAQEQAESALPLRPLSGLPSRAAQAVVACEAVLGHADLVALAGGDGAIRYASGSASTLLGYDVGEKLDTNILDLVHPDDLGEVLEAFASTVAHPGLRQPIECRVRHVDGSVRRVTVVAMNLLDVPDVAALVFAVRFVSQPDRTAIATWTRAPF